MDIWSKILCAWSAAYFIVDFIWTLYCHAAEKHGRGDVWRTRGGGGGWKPRANTGLQACVWCAMTRGGYAVSLATPSQRASHILFYWNANGGHFRQCLQPGGGGRACPPPPRRIAHRPPKPRVRNIARGPGHAPIRRAHPRPPALKQIKY